MDEGITNIEDHRDSQKPEPEVDSRKRAPEKRRAHMRDPGSAIRRLACFAEVDAMVRAGSFLREIVDTIHARGELQDLSRNAVKYMVKNYRDYIYSDSAVIDGAARPNDLDEDDPMYELHSMQKYFKLQEERITQEVDVEKKLTKLFSTTHKEFMVLLSMSKDILKQKKSMGLLDKERGGTRQRVGSGTPGRIDVAEVITNPKSRQKVMGFVEALVNDPDLLDHMSKDAIKKPRTSRPKRRKRRKHDN